MALDDANSIEADLLLGSNFGLEVDGLELTIFTSVDGLGSETEIVEHKTMAGSTGKEVLLKVPGALKWDDITLKRALNGNKDLYEWRQMVVQGDIAGARRNGSIILFDRKGTEAARWNFEKAWPSSLKSGGLDAGSSEVLTEELTIAHEGIERVT